MLNLQVKTVIVEGVEEAFGQLKGLKLVEEVEVNLKPLQLLQPLQLTGCSCLRMSIKKCFKIKSHSL